MELVMWIVVGIAAGLACIVFVPVLVVGAWFVVMTMILRLADGIFWLLDQKWKKNKGGKGGRSKEKLLPPAQYVPSRMI